MESTYTKGKGTNKLFNKYNGKNIYLYEKNGCEIYYKGDPEAKYAILMNEKEVISLPNNDEPISKKTLLDINKYLSSNNPHKSPFIIVYDTNCFKINVDYLSKAQSMVNELNVELDRAGLCLVVDYKMNMKGKEIAEMEEAALTDLMLCLYLKKNMNKCVSSVEMVEEIDDDDEEEEERPKTIVINSMTNEKYEGRKYNKLNRAAVIMIAGRTGHEFVVSNAVHPSSVWLLLNTFKGTIHPDITKPPKLYNKLDKYLESIGGFLEIEIAVNEESVNRAAKVFSEVVSVLSAPSVGGKRRTKKRNN